MPEYNIFDFLGIWAVICATCYGLVIGPLWVLDRLTWRLWGSR